jgi:hypothetical protein
MKIFAFLMRVWALLSPYLNNTNMVQIETAIEKAITDYQGGNYTAVINDLIDAIKAIVPAAGAELDKLKASVAP